MALQGDLEQYKQTQNTQTLVNLWLFCELFCIPPLCYNMNTVEGTPKMKGATTMNAVFYGRVATKEQLQPSIKSLRTKTGMSQRRFANYFNIPLPVLVEWEQGQRECPEYLLELIEYKLNMEYFLYCKISTLPAGYNYINGELVVNEQEAEFVKETFESYLQKNYDTKHSENESIVSQDIFDKAQEKIIAKKLNNENLIK